MVSEREAEIPVFVPDQLSLWAVAFHIVSHCQLKKEQVAFRS